MKTADLNTTKTTRKEDQDLMRRIAEKDQEAFSEFTERYMPLIYSTAHKVLKHVEDAEDVTHDVLLTIWNRANGYDSAKGSLVTWICTTVRNRSIDRVRSFQRRAAMHDRYENSLGEELPERRQGGREELYRSDARRILQNAVVELSAEQREVIELAYFQGLTQTQIADRLESPLGTVKARIRRGVECLRSMVNQRESLDGELRGLMKGLS